MIKSHLVAQMMGWGYNVALKIGTDWQRFFKEKRCSDYIEKNNQ
jgi:hypothetical protein